jgi:hypothetical protein
MNGQRSRVANSLPGRKSRPISRERVSVPTPSGSVNATAYLQGHVYNELRWLLVASTTWVAYQQRGDNLSVRHVDVMSMDSAFLHARNLYEFWRGERRHCELVFGQKGPESNLYLDNDGTLRRALHRKLFHLDSDREFEPRGTSDDTLHTRVREISDDVMEQWSAWRQMPNMTRFHAVMDQVRLLSVEDAAHAAASLAMSPLY